MSGCIQQSNNLLVLVFLVVAILTVVFLLLFVNGVNFLLLVVACHMFLEANSNTFFSCCLNASYYTHNVGNINTKNIIIFRKTSKIVTVTYRYVWYSTICKINLQLRLTHKFEFNKNTFNLITGLWHNIYKSVNLRDDK